MAYIIFVNPQMMSMAGMDQGASFVGTCLAAAIACILMGLYANWPIGLAPGMGLNAFFTYTVVGEMGYSWEIALGAVFIAGILFWIMSITPVRQWMLESIPMNLRIAMGSGVGLFIGLIGLKNGGIIVPNEATLLSMGDFLRTETILSMLGFLLIAILAVRKSTRCNTPWCNDGNSYINFYWYCPISRIDLLPSSFYACIYEIRYFGCTRFSYDQCHYVFSICKLI